MSTRPVSAMVSSSDVSVAPQNEELDGSVQRPCWETGDWEFAGGEEELLMDLGEPMPRVIFGGAPSLQEAKEATSDLKDALETVFLTAPTSSGHESSHTAWQELYSPLLSNSMTKAYVSKDITIPVPKHAIQAFKFLSESTAAQRVVASISSDANVWNAVLQNEALVDFLQEHKSSASVVDIKETAKDSHTDSDFLDQQTPKSFNKSCSGNFLSKEFVFGNGLMDSVHDVKLTVVDMMNSLSYYFQNLFGGTRAEKTSADGSARISLTDKALGASFVGLAVMVIMVVVLKRG